MSMGWDYVFELRPLTSLLLNFQIIYEYIEPRCNNIDGVKLKKLERKVSQCHFVHHKFYMDWTRREPRTAWWEAGD
jgi:hypothetical protein